MIKPSSFNRVFLASEESLVSQSSTRFGEAARNRLATSSAAPLFRLRTRTTTLTGSRSFFSSLGAFAFSTSPAWTAS